MSNSSEENGTEASSGGGQHSNLMIETRMGEKLKSVRLERNLTLKEVGAMVGCSESQLSKIENNHTLPSLPLLHSLVQVLHTNISWLFESEPRGRVIIDKQGQRPLIRLDHLHRGTGISLERVIPYSKDHHLQCNIHHLEPHGTSNGMIAHEGEEVGYVIAGTVALTVDDEVYVLSQGDTFFFPSDISHGYQNLGSDPASIFWVNTPPTF
jgi:transcriptional regulator with XRE-family HTH domain